MIANDAYYNSRFNVHIYEKKTLHLNNENIRQVIKNKQDTTSFIIKKI